MRGEKKEKNWKGRKEKMRGEKKKKIEKEGRRR